MDEKSIITLLKARLSPSRYKHSIEVFKRAGILAAIHGENVEKAKLAGLFHDCCHDLAFDEQLKIINSRGILLDDFTKTQPQLYHAVSGSIFIEDELLTDDAEIVSAVRYHTTGRKNMTRLEQIVFLADYTSLDRTFAGVGKSRRLAEKSLERCMLKSLGETVRFLVKKRLPVVKDTWEAYNYFWELVKVGKDNG